MNHLFLLVAIPFSCISCLYAQETKIIDSYNKNHILSTGTEFNEKIPKKSRLRQLKTRSGVSGAKESSESYVSDDLSFKREYVGKAMVSFDHFDGDLSEYHSNILKEKERVRQLRTNSESRKRREAHPSSPCPSVFSYEGTEPDNGKWHGVITLTSDETLNGIKIEINLDKIANLLESSLGKVSGSNTVYTIWSSKTKLESGNPLSVRITVNYNENGNQPPRIQLIKLNGRKICPSGYGGVVVLPIPPGSSRPSSGSGTPTKSTTVPTPVTSVISTPSQPIDQAGDTELVDGVPCGRIDIQPIPFVTFGQNTSKGQWPWHAAIYISQGNGLTYWCGGSLIGKGTILTAAHCLTKKNTNIPFKTEDLVVYLGKYHLKLWTENGVQSRQVKEMHIHPDYNYEIYKADIAIIKLSSPVDFTTYVKPICLWDRNRPLLSEVEGKEGVVVGWGDDETHKSTEELMMAKMPVVSQNTCIFSHPDVFSTFTSEKTFCAGFRNGTSVCFGDSGGGMVFPKSDAFSDDDITWSLRGIVSFGLTKRNKRECITTHFAVFTDVAKFYDWIQHYR